MNSTIEQSYTAKSLSKWQMAPYRVWKIILGSIVIDQTELEAPVEYLYHNMKLVEHNT